MAGRGCQDHTIAAGQYPAGAANWVKDDAHSRPAGRSRRGPWPTVKALPRQVGPGAACGADLTDGQLLAPRLDLAATVPTGTIGPRASSMASTPGEGCPLPRHPLPAGSAGRVSWSCRPGQLLVIQSAVAQAACRIPTNRFARAPEGLMMGGATARWAS